MKRICAILISLVLLAAVVPLGVAAPLHVWSDGHGGTLGDIGEAVAIDGAGNVYVVGRFQGTANFGGGNLVSAGGEDVFIAKFDAAGAHLWSQRFGSTSGDQGREVAVDYVGNVIIAGYFNLTVNFGAGGIVSNGSSDIFLAKYDANGVHLWSQGFGGIGGDQPKGLATDSGANIVVTGQFSGTVDFGGGNLVSAGSIDVFLAKYGITGTHIWSQRFGGTSTEAAETVAVGSDGTIAITGTFRGTASFGGANLVSDGLSDIYLASYDEDGAHQWSRNFGSVDGEDGAGLAIDALGNVYFTAWFDGTADFGGGPLGEDSGADTMIGKYSAAGEHRWSASYDASNHIFPLGLAIDSSANPVITGYFSGTIDFGGGLITSAGGNEVFIAKFGPPTGPVVTSITDIGNDQGKKVKIRFDRSGHDDASSSTPVLGYDVYRRVDTPPSSSSDRDVYDNDPQYAPPGWTYLATAPAHGESGYGIDVATLADSTGTYGQFWSVFFIRASTVAPTTFWDSDPDSGYSLDNLSPGVPMAAAFNGGIISWTKPDDPDLDYFTVYGANTDDFGAGVVVDYTSNESLDVGGSPYAYYFITATDESGNEGAPAQTSSPTGVGGTPQRYTLSVGNYPNPFNPVTTVRYTIPSAGSVTVTVYDARGSFITTLVGNEAHTPGAYVTAWNGRDAGGTAVSSGVYFARIEHGGRTQSRKMLLLK